MCRLFPCAGAKMRNDIHISSVVFIVKKIEPTPYSPPPKPPTPVPTSIKEKGEAKGSKKGGKEKEKEAEKPVAEPVIVVSSCYCFVFTLSQKKCAT